MFDRNVPHWISTAACALSAVLVVANPGRAGTSAAVAVAAASPPNDDLQRRFAGFYRYAGDAAEEKARMDAIDRSARSVFFAFRGVARSKLDRRTRIIPDGRFEFSDGNIRSIAPGYPAAVSPQTGAPAPYLLGDYATVLSQRFDGDRLVQIFEAEEGAARKNEFTLSPDGSTLTLRTTLSSPKLSIPVGYTLTYRRAE
jgi:hypothetical protein